MNDLPIFASIFGDQWEHLPPVMRKHYANRPYSDDVTVAKGTMDISCNRFGRLCMPLFRLFGTLVPYMGNDIPVTVAYKSCPDSDHFLLDRAFHFPDKKPFHFRSCMMPITQNFVVEMMRFNVGWKTSYHYENSRVMLQHQGYVLRFFGFYIPLPLALFIGKGHAEEQALSDQHFSMFMTITHPWWGTIYKYKGTFTFEEEIRL